MKRRRRLAAVILLLPMGLFAFVGGAHPTSTRDDPKSSEAARAGALGPAYRSSHSGNLVAIHPSPAAALSASPMPPPSGSSMGGAGSGEPGDDQEITEDELIEASDNTPEQRIWRRTWALERQDDVWTAAVRTELAARTREVLRGALEVSDLSCHDTICRMILRFESERDATAFQEARHDPDLRHEYQPFGLDYGGDPAKVSDHRYELMIKRELPAGRIAQPLRELSHEAVVGGPEPKPLVLQPGA